MFHRHIECNFLRSFRLWCHTENLIYFCCRHTTSQFQVRYQSFLISSISPLQRLKLFPVDYTIFRCNFSISISSFRFMLFIWQRWQIQRRDLLLVTKLPLSASTSPPWCEQNRFPVILAVAAFNFSFAVLPI